MRFTRLLVRIVSEICITVGAALLLFVAYVLMWTGVKADSAVEGELDRLEKRWSQSTPPPARPEASATPPAPAPARTPTADAYEDGKPFAVMRVPRFGDGWEWPVLQGVGAAVLKRGLGHYPSTARLGEEGNVAVAGHRRTYGDPFRDFPELRAGDAVLLNDGATRYTYRIVARPYQTVPSDVGVVEPVPRPLRAGAAPFDGPGRYLTLTTCDPEWGSSHRLVAWARLEAKASVTDGGTRAVHS
ncbi:class E sortase [Streptomyces sp. HNM0663]|uniref:Class E sortase n=1 Tax=Streptomyces chengmaiensis TaxID=3040919 RepID=A0ABT6HIK2_9ACTN|nr:class E sortase [Streptomyces chengmaiensis]MDH2388135.1 class E sortase [Streptomyces chengmaiensis]